MDSQSPYRIATKEQTIAEGVDPCYRLGHNGDLLQMEGGARTRFALGCLGRRGIEGKGVLSGQGDVSGRGVLSSSAWYDGGQGHCRA